MARSPIPVLLASFLLLPAALQAAGPASLVADINTTESAGASEIGIQGQLLRLGDNMLFNAVDSSSGAEPWVSDGTALGTKIVRDVCVGCSSNPHFLGATGGHAVFLVETDGSFEQRDLWRSNGSREGTAPVRSGFVRCFGSFTQSAEIGGVVVFTARSAEADCGLWRTDGSAAGTRLLVDIPFFSGLYPLLEEPERAGDKLFFLTPSAEGGILLWRTDGTEAGTLQLGRFADRDDVLIGRPRFLTAAGSRIFFLAEGLTGEGQELWTSDGTPAGTRAVTRFIPERPFRETQFLKALDGIVYFVADDVTGGSDLWRSDGTQAGTRRVTDFGFARPFEPGLGPLQLAKAGNRLVFLASDGLTPWQVWTSGGTPATTAALAGCPGGCPAVDFNTELASAGNRVVFSGARPAHDFEPWSTDGTGPGTRQLGDLCPTCGSSPREFVFALGRLFFVAGVVGSGDVLWSTDGTPEGTLRLTTLGHQTFELPFSPITIGNRIYFAAGLSPGIGTRGRQLWTSDGTPEGSGLVTVLGDSAPGSSPFELTGFGNSLLFLAFDGRVSSLWRTDGTAGGTAALPSTATEPSRLGLPHDLTVAGGLTFFLRNEPSGHERRIWRTDGTDAGTLPVSPPGLPNVGHLAAFRGKAVFTSFVSGAPEPSTSTAFWESDGTAAGTRKLFDLEAVLASGLLEIGPDLYFLAYGGSQEQVWASDGTAAGTRKLTDFQFGAFDSLELPEMVRAGGRVYFPAQDFSGQRLWTTDGTAAGTFPIVLPGVEASSPHSLAEFQGRLYFIGRTQQGTLGRGLWKSDGTAAGTVLVKPVAPPDGSFRPEPAWPTVLGPHLLFMADDGEHGRELWRTDGTSEGTVLVRDIAPGGDSSYPRELTAAGGRVFFRATNGVHGFEPWESDGTAAGTRMVQDIAPDGLSSNPEELTEAGGRLYFRADDGLSGVELWSLPLAGPPVCQPSELALCLGGGRFRVEATWRDFQGNTGRGHAVPLTGDTGYFWFFDPANVEVILKVLDGRGLNGHHWVFYGALSTVEYTLTVTDVQTGASRRYINPPGKLGSLADVDAFGPRGARGAQATLGPAAIEHEPVARIGKAAATPCVPSATRLCLQGGRFAVEADWRDFQGNEGKGTAVPLPGGDTGYFWFFGPENVEVVLKVLDGRPLTGRFWVFYGALSSVQYTLTVTDTETGTVKEYKNPSGRLGSVADTGAF